MIAPPRYALLVTATALTLAACSTVTDGNVSTAPTSSDSPPSGASSGSKAPETITSIPHQPPDKNTDGTTFDPCIAYTADEIRRVGLDPATIQDVPSHLQRGCKWKGAGWRAQVTVLNGSIDRYLDPKLFPGSQPVTIEGLGGATYRSDPGDMQNCFVEIPSQQATVGTIVEVTDTPALQQIPDACSKAVEVATLTANKLPK